MKNTLRFVFMSCLLCIGALVYAQDNGPVCIAGLNIPIGGDDSATIAVANFVTNITDAGVTPLQVKLLNAYGGVIAVEENADENTEFRILACPYVSRELMLQVQNAHGACMSMMTFKQSNGPIIEGRADTVYCGDPLVVGGHIDGVAPTAEVPCGDDKPATFVADWIEVFPCVLGRDTAKIIIREYEAFDKFGNRGVGKDTIYVFNLPEITRNNTFCAEKDTTYCGSGLDYFGPFMLVPESIGATTCEPIYFINPDGTKREFDPKCGISTVLTVEPFDGKCSSTLKYTLEIKQSCYGPDPDVCDDQDVPENGLEVVAPGYLRCVFWLIDLDTLGPTVECDTSHFTNFDGDTILIPTGSHDCAAHFTLPPANAFDDCTDVVSVKAMIEGYGSFAFEYNGSQWVSNNLIKLPLAEEPIQIIYEAFDACHNPGYDTCYIKVKDLTNPVAVCDKGINVSLTGKKVWVDAETFDEGSWDNCGVHLILARRGDWREACVDLCDSLVVHSVSLYGETIWQPVLNENKLEEEAEAHYAKAIDWLANDGTACGKLIARAWNYDLIKYATVDCKNEMDGNAFDDAYLGAHDSDLAADIKQIGGGWAEDVLFSCDDACGPVSVEILVMDYWCNWSKCWTDVWVEDKTPITIAKDVVPVVDITCKTFRALDYQLGGIDASIGDLVSAAGAGDVDAFAALDEIFGGYAKAWIDPYGNYVDLGGNVLDCDITLIDSTCHCENVLVPVRVYDDHTGAYTYVDKWTRDCSYDAEEEDLNHGVISINCPKNVQCDQEIWYDFDECGQGSIYRKFKIYQGCPVTVGTSAGHIPDTITRIQQIWVGNECELDSGMFTFPLDTTIDLCGLEYGDDGNVVGDAHPDNVGLPTYDFDDDCRLVGIGHYDKVFRVVGGDEACFKIVRTWCFADWCESGKPVGDNWVNGNGGGKVFEYQQKIIVRDTVGPMCTITGPIGDGETIQAGGCVYDLSATIDVEDACGIISYSARLEDITKDPVVVANWNSSTNPLVGGQATLEVEDLVAGDYKLTAVTTDDCQNESLCVYSFTVETGKKPSPVCISSITVELTPWDTDNDGVIDTAAATVWAKEFNSSSSAPCGSDDDDLEFYIEFKNDADSSTLDLGQDLDSLALGCEHFGPQVVRMWVLSPTGSADYCDVMLIVQNNMGGCGDVSANQGSVTGSIATELNQSVEQVQVKASLSNGTSLDFLTTSSGAYGFASTLGVDVKVEPIKDIEHDNGISTADMIQIQKHILGREQLDNEYRLMAADVNNDDRISALDLLDIRRLILGKTDRFPNSDSWSFVNDVDGRSTYTIKGINGAMAVDFIGVKKGDVNISNDPSRGARSAKSLVLQTSDQELSVGEQYKVDITAGNFRDIEGYQFTLNFDAQAVKLVDVEIADGLNLEEENFSFEAVEQGMIATSWHSAEAIELNSDDVLFSLVFDAKVEGQLSEVLTVNSKITDAEAYNSTNELLGVALEFTNAESVDAAFTLYQNRPNPFKENTVIGFRLPEATATALTVYDVTGKVLKVINGDFQKGYNEVSLKKNDLNATGVLYYQLDSDTYTATRKMVIIE
ncbi:MAG: T9SS type A sorting domain-containing protein [Saprospiraceae bacterium]|nr:T9SS type A sorting domain-containing protein [Saprospiraceae bacterium]